MAIISKAILLFQVHLTAIMILVAGMPHFACRCPGQPANPPQQVSSTATCCCCGSCGSMQDKPSCCNHQSPGKSKARSHQATGNDCTKITGLPKNPAISTTEPIKLIEVSSSAWAPCFLAPFISLQTEQPDAVSRWSGHSPAPPPDCVISLQRLLI